MARGNGFTITIQFAKMVLVALVCEMFTLTSTVQKDPLWSKIVTSKKNNNKGKQRPVICEDERYNLVPYDYYFHQVTSIILFK